MPNSSYLFIRYSKSSFFISHPPNIESFLQDLHCCLFQSKKVNTSGFYLVTVFSFNFSFNAVKFKVSKTITLLFACKVRLLTKALM